jgi:sigma-B regulation protein RsbU (phosphoserine phosphatase)
MTTNSAHFRQEDAQKQLGCDGAVQNVLVVDDSEVQRRILTSSLRRWGYSVFEADSGEQALELCASTPMDLIFSDWMMPGMNGLDFCRAFRKLYSDRYGYFILLSSKSDKGEVAQGLDVGADDFLTKPVHSAELRARIEAGERILRMERELTEKNRLVTSTLAKIQTLYDSLDRDLIEARKLQQSLVREKFRDFGSAQVSLFLRPCGHVGGDLVGIYDITPTRIGVYGIDVSGHGVSSALMTARLAGYLSGAAPDQNIALLKNANGYTGRPPAEVAAYMNTLVFEEMETDHYFTLVLAEIDLETGLAIITQAGHPHPVVQRHTGEVEFHGNGGLPIGLISDATYDQFQVQLMPGDRLILASDGITECPDGNGKLLDEDGFETLLRYNSNVSCAAFFEAMIWDLGEYANGQEFPDDISAVLFEYRGQVQPRN